MRATVGVSGPYRAPATPYKTISRPFISPALKDSAKSVYLQTMKNQQLTPPRVCVRDSVSLLLTSWTDAEAQYGGINRGELEDENLLLEEPNFAQLAP